MGLHLVWALMLNESEFEEWECILMDWWSQKHVSHLGFQQAIAMISSLMATFFGAVQPQHSKPLVRFH